MSNDTNRPIPVPAEYLDAFEQALETAAGLEYLPGIVENLSYEFCGQEIYIPVGLKLCEERTSAMFNILNFLGYAQQVAIAVDPDFRAEAARLARDNAERAHELLSAAGYITQEEAVNHYGMYSFLRLRVH